MIRLTDEYQNDDGGEVGAIWIGNSDDEKGANLKTARVSAVLNVAHDMYSTREWDRKLEYMHVGLIDGPGNPPAVYCAAVLALSVLLSRHNVLVCCHTSSRSLAVVITYLIVKRGKVSDHPTFFNYWVTWDKMLGELQDKVVQDLPRMNECHRKAVDKLPLAVLETLL